MNARILIAKAITDTRRLDGSLDTLAITHRLIDHGVLLGDEETIGEGRVIRALESAGEEAHDSQIVAEILTALGYTEAAA